MNYCLTVSEMVLCALTKFECVIWCSVTRKSVSSCMLVSTLPVCHTAFPVRWQFKLKRSKCDVKDQQPEARAAQMFYLWRFIWNRCHNVLVTKKRTITASKVNSKNTFLPHYKCTIITIWIHFLWFNSKYMTKIKIHKHHWCISTTDKK